MRTTDFIFYVYCLLLIIWHVDKGLWKKAKESHSKICFLLVTIFLKPTQIIFVTGRYGVRLHQRNMEAKLSEVKQVVIFLFFQKTFVIT